MLFYLTETGPGILAEKQILGMMLVPTIPYNNIYIIYIYIYTLLNFVRFILVQHFASHSDQPDVSGFLTLPHCYCVPAGTSRYADSSPKVILSLQDQIALHKCTFMHLSNHLLFPLF